MTVAPHVHIPFEKIGEHLDLILHHRLNLEIFFSGDTLDVLTDADALLTRRLLDYGPDLSFHAPFMDLSPGAVDSLARAATLRRFSRVLDLAQLMRATCVVFHSGYEKWKYALKVEKWLDKSLETWRPLNARAETNGIKIAIENIFEDEPSNLRLLMQEMDSPNFGICFDTGHWNLFAKTPLQEWLTMLSPYIIELHLHDNEKDADSHFPIGDGTFDFRTLFSALRDKEMILTIETHTPERVLRSIEALRRLANPRT